MKVSSLQQALCKHCFEPGSDITVKLGMKMARRLKLNAVPSIFERKRPATAVLEDDGATSSGDGGRKRAAFEKRERSRVFSDY